MSTQTVVDSGAYLKELMELDKSTLPPDGGSRFNRLIFARSPYLLQHAGNPVDWYEWGDEAFELARTENRPILLSIGYATCHWCHVMAHESFEDDEIAKLLNRYYVCIKVDREERPDIDDFYMTVAQVLTGSGGWPLNIFMMPDRRPFFAITYLPRNDRQGMRGFLGLLGNIATLWRQHPDRIRHNCDSIMDTLENISQPIPQELSDLAELEKEAFSQLAGIYDEEYGGFGTTLKFPMPINISWLMGQGAAGNRKALDMGLDTLRAVRRGGIWDQLGGGVHRYAVDREWLVPHFEKMLYDQAMLSMTALEAFQVSGEALFLDMAMDIFGFVAAELTAPGGGFYSALDADSEGEEGTFYVWSKEEVETLLGSDAPVFCRFFNVTPYGNFEGNTVLAVGTDFDRFCEEEDIDPDELEQILSRCSRRLLDVRSRRIRPLRDEKIITSWNGLMIAALARGGAICGLPDFVDRAAAAARFILDNLRRSDGRLLRSHLGTASDTAAFLEDHVFLTHGLIELFEATLERCWLDAALILADETVRLFYDSGRGQFTKTGLDAEQMLLRASLEHDGVLPSPYSLAARNFYRLSWSCRRADLLDHAHGMLVNTLDDARRHPTAHLGSLQALALLEHEPVTAEFSGDRSSETMPALLQQLKAAYLPSLVISGTDTQTDPPSVSVCAPGTCYPAASDPERLMDIISRVTPAVRNGSAAGRA